MLMENKVMAQARAFKVEKFTADVMPRIETLIRDTTLVSRKVRPLLEGERFSRCGVHSVVCGYRVRVAIEPHR